MLQVALGGTLLVDGQETTLISDPTYYEPGFNLMSPLEISTPQADQIFILVRKRIDDSGFRFEDLGINEIAVSAVDITNGEPLSIGIASNTVNDEWNDVNPSFPNTPTIVTISNQINLGNPILRVRVIDCNIRDLTDDSFINFRIIVDEDASTLMFNYIPVYRKTISDRNTFTIASRLGYVTLRSDTDAYLLLSPYSWLQESTKDVSDFSYPEDSIYYQRQKTYNNEDFSFSLISWSHSFVEENVSVLNVPGYKKAGIVQFDNAIYNHLVEIGVTANLIVRVVGELSGITDDFQINLSI